VRLATCESDVRAAQRLRFEVFNKELNEGLASAWETGATRTGSTALCPPDRRGEHHRQIVGTYRMLPGPGRRVRTRLLQCAGVRLRPLRALQGQILELGRACVHLDHRNQTVVGILWRGISIFARSRGARTSSAAAR
jgi:putative hemolysin